MAEARHEFAREEIAELAAQWRILADMAAYEQRRVEP